MQIFFFKSTKKSFRSKLLREITTNFLKAKLLFVFFNQRSRGRLPGPSCKTQGNHSHCHKYLLWCRATAQAHGGQTYTHTINLIIGTGTVLWHCFNFYKHLRKYLLYCTSVYLCICNMEVRGLPTCLT